MDINPKEMQLIYSQDLTGGGGKSWELCKDSNYGRYLKAHRNFEEGDTIFLDTPLLHGPIYAYNHLICVACYRHLVKAGECGGCGWPICGDLCSCKNLHSKQECNIMAKKRNTLKNKSGDFILDAVNYNCIYTIRILLFKLHDQAKWEKFCLLDAQLDEWKKKPDWLEMETPAARYILEMVKPEIDTNLEEILWIFGVCYTNTFSKCMDPNEKNISSSETASLQWTKIRISYLLASMMSHSCIPNAEQSISSMKDGLKFMLRAIRPIKKGDQICLSYTDLFEPTVMRQTHLWNDKLFVCQCKRCSDVEELGTNCGTMKCLTCLKSGKKPCGLLLPSKQDDKIWSCSSCGTDAKSSKVVSLLQKIKDDIAFVDKPQCSLQDAEKLLRKYSQLLHNGHGLLLKIKYQICGMYGRSQGYLLEDLSLEQLERKKSLCEEVLKFLSIIQPFTVREGVILYELSCALVTIAKHYMDKDKTRAEDYLKKSLVMLRRSQKILCNESVGTFEHGIAQGGKQTLCALENYFK